MAIYRLDLDRPALIKLLGGTSLLGGILFFSGTLVGYSASAGAAQGDPTGLAPVTGEAAQAAASGAVAGVGFASLTAEPICPATSGPSAAPPAAPPVVIAAADPGAALGDDEAPPPRLRALEALVDPAATPTPATRFAVQVGAFSVRGNADALAARLEARGYDPLVVTARSRSGQWLEYVRLSVHPQEIAAQRVAGEFTLREQLPAIVVAVAEDGGAPR